MGNIKRGDRVKATNKNGDTAEFTVISVIGDGKGLDSMTNTYAVGSGWTFDKITPPLPTEPGIYQPNNRNESVCDLRTFVLGMNGRWAEYTEGTSYRAPEQVLLDVEGFHERMGLVRLVRET